MEGYKSEVKDKAREKCNHKGHSELSIPSGQQLVTSNKSKKALRQKQKKETSGAELALAVRPYTCKKEINKEIGTHVGDQRFSTEMEVGEGGVQQ